MAAEGTVAEVSRLAAAPRSARLRVPPDSVGEALRVLSHVRGLEAAERVDGQPGTLTLTLQGDQDGGLGDLVNSGVPVLAFELEGARLSDAFLAMTEGVGDD